MAGIGKVSLEIMDTAGTGQHYTNNRQLYISSGHVFGLIYSVDSRKSLDSLQDLYRDIVRLRRSPNVPIVLVGNKCDVTEEEREVGIEDARLTVRKSWGVGTKHLPLVIETSAKDGKNIDELFQYMARMSCAALQSATLRTQRSATLVPQNGRKATSLPRDGLLIPNGKPGTLSRDATISSLQVKRYSNPPQRPGRKFCTIL